uniref:Ferritin n=1 Tax=Xenopsylla cheopis TaxID=163159 RepID=A0A6M2DZY9_XENCH
MKCLILLGIFVVAANAQSCYDDTQGACSRPGASDDLPNCNAKYSGFETVSADLSSYVKRAVLYSYDYLLMSTHFGNYEKNRAGFEKLFKGLSDFQWESAIDVIKYVTKRGGSIDFQTNHNTNTTRVAETTELQSLAKALENEKVMAKEIHSIHRKVARLHHEHQAQDNHDPETASYLEEHFAHKQAKTIRDLSGHTNDLKNLLKSGESSLSLYLFDEYLQKL